MAHTRAEGGQAGAEAGTHSEDHGRFRRGFRRSVDAFAAFREALGETIHEARERGDFSVDRARDVMKDAVGKAREATTDARGRFDFVTRGEFQALIRRVRELEARIQAVEETDGPADGPRSP